MTGTPLEKIAGRGVYVAGNDIDTDRIIPARFLKCVTFDELGPALFYDERFATDSQPAGDPGAASNGAASTNAASTNATSTNATSTHATSTNAASAHVKSKGHILDAPQHQGAEVLITDSNFGCGSSREHAPQAIQKFGFKAVIAGSFAEIFHGNCTTLGIPCLVMADDDRHQLAADVQANPDEELICDLEQLQVIFANRIYQVQMKESAREAFLNAAWDPLDTLLAAQEGISQVAAKLDYGSAA